MATDKANEIHSMEVVNERIAKWENELINIQHKYAFSQRSKSMKDVRIKSCQAMIDFWTAYKTKHYGTRGN